MNIDSHYKQELMTNFLRACCRRRSCPGPRHGAAVERERQIRKDAEAVDERLRKETLSPIYKSGATMAWDAPLSAPRLANGMPRGGQSERRVDGAGTEYVVENHCRTADHAGLITVGGGQDL